ncbi:MAG: FAD-dependent monooxygenase [Myxococcota bacterium]
MKVAVVGGSIAGCSAAILFERAGHQVQVYERGTGALVGRGGGIGVSQRVLASMIQYDMLDEDFAYCRAESMPFVVKTGARPRRGHRPWDMPSDLATFHWSALWRQLRQRVPDATYRAGAEVWGATERSDGRVVVQLSDGSEPVFDLVIFADGHRSTARHRLFPDVELTYRGYVHWRGLLPESSVDDTSLLEGAAPRVSYAEGAGNLVATFLPSAKGSTERGRRLVDWAAYVTLPAGDVDAFMTDRQGRVREGTLPPGTMREEEEHRLKVRLRNALPEVFGEMVERTKSTHAQLVYTAQMPAYRRGRQVVIGDAGTVTPPFTGSGVFKGFQNAASLLETTAAHASLDDALDSWSAKQVRLGERLTGLGERMEQALIWNPLDLTRADASATQAWWQQSVTAPAGFTPEGAPRMV